MTYNVLIGTLNPILTHSLTHSMSTAVKDCVEEEDESLFAKMRPYSQDQILTVYIR